MGRPVGQSTPAGPSDDDPLTAAVNQPPPTGTRTGMAGRGLTDPTI